MNNLYVVDWDHGSLGAEAGYSVEFYKTADGRTPVDEILDEIIPKHRAKILRWMASLAADGPNLPRPYADALQDKIRELRVSIGHHQYRFLHFFHGKTAVITHGFLKKSARVPASEFERAKRHMQDWLNRYGGKGGY